MSSSKRGSIVAEAPEAAAVKPGDKVRYLIPGELVEAEATVVEVEAGGVELVYRDQAGEIRGAQHVRHAPGTIGGWYFKGESTAAARTPEAGGRPLAVGQPIDIHVVVTGVSTETFKLVRAVIVEVIGGEFGEFVTEVPPGGGRQRLRASGYRPRFRRGAWSWPEDDAQLPAPRKFGYLDRCFTCPITGWAGPRSKATPVQIGLKTDRLDFASADALLSAEGAALLKRLLAGEPVELPARPAPKSGIPD